MTWHNPKSSKEDRIKWLKENPDLWRDIGMDEIEDLELLADQMKLAELYSAHTSRSEIAYRLWPLITEARKQMKKEGKNELCRRV
jgi:gas vesicle protein